MADKNSKAGVPSCFNTDVLLDLDVLFGRLGIFSCFQKAENHFIVLLEPLFVRLVPKFTYALPLRSSVVL